MLRCCAIALALRGSVFLRGLMPPPVSDILGFGRLTFGGLMPPPVSDTLGFGRPLLFGPAIALGLLRVLAIAFCLETFVRDLRIIDFLPTSFRKILSPLVFQSLQQQ